MAATEPLISGGSVRGCSTAIPDAYVGYDVVGDPFDDEPIE